jgi:hypothetical protein
MKVWQTKDFFARSGVSLAEQVSLFVNELHLCPGEWVIVEHGWNYERNCPKGSCTILYYAPKL